MRRAAFVGISLWLSALAVSACALPSITAQPTTTPTADPVEVGQQVYLRLCAQCHGEEGEGYANELAAPGLDSSEHAFHHADQEIYDWIIHGRQTVGLQMPAYGDQLSEEEACLVIIYLHTLWTPGQLAFQQDVTSRRPETEAYPCEL